MTQPDPNGSQERPGASVARPGIFLLVLIASVSAAGYAIYWLIRAGRG
ncbi:MAG: hypothetical protein ACOY0T_15650 [Myxococcota bacterium]